MSAPTQLSARERHCPRCGGLIVTQYDERSCFACGYDPESAAQRRRAEEAYAFDDVRYANKARRREPSYKGRRL